VAHGRRRNHYRNLGSRIAVIAIGLRVSCGGKPRKQSRLAIFHSEGPLGLHVEVFATFHRWDEKVDPNQRQALSWR
jgi:hypothetical protein